jgi:ABC-2 type transport system ATP-binding protein
MTAIIEADGLTKVYPPSTKAVDGITFTVERGETFGFLGPNGAGKTTTIKMLTTLSTITAGRASIAGQDVSENPSAVRRIIGMVPQELTADDELKGTENLMLAAKLHHVPEKEARQRAPELLKLVDLEEASQRRVRSYSGGMRRRLQLAMGLIHTPEVLFLDEPTLGLDIQTRRTMWDYLKRLNKDDGLTVFMTTHYLEEADLLCDRVAIIDHGALKAIDTPAHMKHALGGDVLTIGLNDGVDLSGFFSSLPDVHEVVRSGQIYRMKLPKPESALPAIVEGITGRGLKITEISFTKPTLDEVFLEVVGKTMRDGDEGGESWVANVNRERMK